MKLLLTGFEPWNSHINPSWEAVKLTPDRVEGIKIEKLMLPVSAQRAVPLLKERMRAIVPDAVICTGQDGRKQAITIERIAINLDDYRVPDNDGIIIKDKKIVDDGPDAYFSTLPVRRMLDAIMARGRSGCTFIYGGNAPVQPCDVFRASPCGKRTAWHNRRFYTCAA